ncbi:hypothetical protein L2E82_31572 [Cichorium intybus]|uniref:Uncharacterized protein n=1 Tax=Cichorium intybus TaxID=13427 RepID=A0ACB9BET1_CICIN|nr:hypothetical protein L2E82_31572 [Cichorium intybus]
MSAINDFVLHFEWKEVIPIFVDDGYGGNIISALSDALSKKQAKISYKASFTPDVAECVETTTVEGVEQVANEPQIWIRHGNIF